MMMTDSPDITTPRSQTLTLLLAPWLGLIPAWLILHAIEWPQIASSTLNPLDVVSQLVASDILLLLRALPLWCLIALPLAWLRPPARNSLLMMLGSLLLIVLASLNYYASAAGVPLGADVLGYSLDEMRTTVSADMTHGVPVLLWLPLTLALLTFWLIYGLLLRHTPKTLPPRATWITLGVCVSGSVFLPLAWPTQASGLPAITSNKLGYLVADVMRSQLPDTELNEAESTVNQAYPFDHADTTPDTLGPLLDLTDTPPHIVVVVVEGLGRSFSGPNARLGSFTPFLDELTARSVYWDNFLATQGRTFAALPSILASLPFVENNAKTPRHASLPGLLKDAGYDLRYFTGSDLEFDQQGDYLRAIGVTSQWSERDFPASLPRLTEWGVADGPLLQTVSTTPTANVPTLTIVQTMSMHSPFMVPDQAHWRSQVSARLDQLGIPRAKRAPYERHRDIYASILYTDHALREFFQRMEKKPDWNNTIVVITGDHRLPELAMETRLERYHVPLIVASAMVKKPLRVQAVSSHVDITPSLIAMLSNRYGIQTPARLHWVGTGLDVSPEWRNLHRLALKQTKTDFNDYVSGLHYLAQNQLYNLQPGLNPEPEDDPATRARLQGEFAAIRTSLATLARSSQLLDPGHANKRTPYVASQRTLEPENRASHMQGLVVSNTSGRFLPDGTLEATARITQYGSLNAPVFVPLMVLMDGKGKELGEAYGKALHLKPGQSASIELSLKPAQLSPGTYYIAMLASHPDTGKSIGTSQYHVEIKL